MPAIARFVRDMARSNISDQNGSLVLDIKEADALGEYRFGHKLGKFVFCRNCGVFVAVLFETDGRMFGCGKFSLHWGKRY